MDRISLRATSPQESFSHNADEFPDESCVFFGARRVWKQDNAVMNETSCRAGKWEKLRLYQ